MWGTYYEMGKAHGQLVSAESKQLYKEVFAWIEDQVWLSNTSTDRKVEQALHMLPAFLRDLIAKYGVKAALEATYYLTKSYTPEYFFDELRGEAIIFAWLTILRICWWFWSSLHGRCAFAHVPWAY